MAKDSEVARIGSSLVARRRRVASFALGMAVAAMPLGMAYADTTWTGTNSQDFNDAGNWDNGVPNNTNTFIKTTTGNYPILNGPTTATPVDFYVGSGSGNTARFDQTAGSLATGNGNWALIGVDASTGTFNLADTASTGSGLTGFAQGSGSFTAGQIWIGGADYHDTGGTGTFNVNTTGTITNQYNMIVGQAYGTNSVTNATMNLESGTLNVGQELWIGRAGTGTVNQSGGVINTNSWFVIGRESGSVNNQYFTAGNGTLNLTGGTINAATAGGSTTIASFADANGSAKGVLNVSGTGVFNSLTGGIYVGEGGNGTMNVSGGGIVNAGGGLGVAIGQNNLAVGVVNLNAGGTINASRVGGGTGNSTLNLNGGTLKATGDSGNFVGGVTHAVVQSGGAIIDTDTHNVSVSQSFEHDATLGATADGGLVKNGSGTLTLSGTSTYTGATVINAGTIRLPNGGAPQAVARYSFDELADGTVVGGEVVANTGTGGSALNGVANHANNALDPSGGQSLTVTTGHTGKGLTFDGLGSSIDVASKIVDQSGSNTWTFSSWIQTTTPGASIVAKDDGDNQWSDSNSVFYLGSNPIGQTGSLPTAVRYGGGWIQGDPTPVSLTDGQWHMVTYVDKNGVKQIYVDGVATTMTINEFRNNDVSSITRLGYGLNAGSGDGSVNFAGTMDELQWFSDALTPAQIQQLFANNLVTTGFGSQQYLPMTSAISMPNSGAALDLNGNDQTIGSLSGVAGTSVLLGSGKLTLGTNDTSTSFAGVISGNGGLTKTGTGTQTLTGANTYSGGTTVAGGTLKLTAPAYGVVLGNATVTSPGGADIQSGKLVLDYTGGSSPASQVQSILTSGYGQATKFSSGLLRSSTLAANRTLGWRDTGSTVEVAYTLAGDTDLNYSVNFTDLLALAKNYNGSGKVWAQGDFDYNGAVNFTDLLALAKNYNQTLSADQASQLGASFSADFAMAQALAPEPATLTALGLAGATLIRRRRRMA